MNGSIPNHDYFGGQLIMNGPGVLDLAVAEPYTGGTTINNGTLELGVADAAGTGAITFGTASRSTRWRCPRTPSPGLSLR